MGCTVTVDMEMPAWQLHSLTSQQQDLLVEKLKSHPLFEGMDNIALESEITKVIERKTYIQEENLFQTKYDGPQYIYFISCGKFKLIAASSPMNNPKMQANFAADSEKGSGDIIGELDTKRGVGYNLKCLSESAEVLRISRRDYDEIKDRSIARSYALLADILSNCPLFKDLPTETLKKVQSFCITKKILQGEALIEKDASCERIYLVETSKINGIHESSKFNTSSEPTVQYCCVGMELAIRDTYESTITSNCETTAYFIEKLQLEPLLRDRWNGIAKTILGDSEMSNNKDTNEEISTESTETVVIPELEEEDIRRALDSELNVDLDEVRDTTETIETGQLVVKVDNFDSTTPKNNHTPISKDSKIVAPIVAAIEAHLLTPIEYPDTAPTDIPKQSIVPEPVKIGAVQGSVSWKNSFHISSSEASFTDGESFQQSAKSFPLNCNSEDDHKFILQMSQLQLQAGFGSINRYNSWGVGSNYHKDDHTLQSQSSKMNVLESMENDENGKPWLFRD